MKRIVAKLKGKGKSKGKGKGKEKRRGKDDSNVDASSGYDDTSAEQNVTSVDFHNHNHHQQQQQQQQQQRQRLSDSSRASGPRATARLTEAACAHLSQPAPHPHPNPDEDARAQQQQQQQQQQHGELKRESGQHQQTLKAGVEIENEAPNADGMAIPETPRSPRSTMSEKETVDGVTEMMNGARISGSNSSISRDDRKHQISPSRMVTTHPRPASPMKEAQEGKPPASPAHGLPPLPISPTRSRRNRDNWSHGTPSASLSPRSKEQQRQQLAMEQHPMARSPQRGKRENRVHSPRSPISSMPSSSLSPPPSSSSPTSNRADSKPAAKVHSPAGAPQFRQPAHSSSSSPSPSAWQESSSSSLQYNTSTHHLSPGITLRHGKRTRPRMRRKSLEFSILEGMRHPDQLESVLWSIDTGNHMYAPRRRSSISHVPMAPASYGVNKKGRGHNLHASAPMFDPAMMADLQKEWESEEQHP